MKHAFADGIPVDHAVVEGPAAEAGVAIVDLDAVMTAKTAEIIFATDVGGIYILERTAKPFSMLAFAHVTGTKNTGAKALAGTPCKLGLAKP